MTTEDLVRVGSYLGVLGFMAGWELLAPRRPLTASKLRRWGGNLTVVMLNTVIARLLFAGGVVAMAAVVSLFNHSNVHIPLSLDRILRWFVVTPDMHRIHHSTAPRETNSNYGFSLPWWDRLFGTYCAEPALGQLGMTIGLEHLGPPVCLNLFRMLRFPFVTTLGRYTGTIPAAESSPPSKQVEAHAIHGRGGQA